MRKTYFLTTCFGLILSAVLISQCKTDKGSDGAFIIPEPLPSVVPGFSFPTDSNTVYSWLQPTYDSVSVYKHAWGVWAGLTASSGQAYQGDSLLVYQTWLGIGEIQTLAKEGFDGSEKLKKTGRTPLEVPKQFLHAARFMAAANGGQVDTSANFNNNWTSVSYDPLATVHVLKNGLLKQSVISGYVKNNAIGNVPAFPAGAITIKPVYYVGKKTDSLIRVSAWPGPPPVPAAYPDTQWESYVFADPTNSQTPGKIPVPVPSDNVTPQQMAAATVNLSDFINFKLDSAMANYINKQQGPVQGVTASAGDVAILVAMHVTTKEISNWTWQTFYWAPNPADPKSPSSPLAASLRPSQLKGAASHYALSTAYVEVLPNQPITGGTNTGVSPMIGYNPYLEAPFGPNVFGFANAMNPAYQYGIQTNCMSCHAMATSDGTTKNNSLPYTTDQYIDMQNPVFKNWVQLDFAWSVQQAIFNDSTTQKKK